jgi:hypothetical protein
MCCSCLFISNFISIDCKFNGDSIESAVSVLTRVSSILYAEMSNSTEHSHIGEHKSTNVAPHEGTVTYSLSFLRSMAHHSKISRCVRRSLFKHQLWRPRFSARQTVYTCRVCHQPSSTILCHIHFNVYLGTLLGECIFNEAIHLSNAGFHAYSSICVCYVALIITQEIYFTSVKQYAPHHLDIFSQITAFLILFHKVKTLICVCANIISTAFAIIHTCLDFTSIYTSNHHQRLYSVNGNNTPDMDHNLPVQYPASQTKVHSYKKHSHIRRTKSKSVLDNCHDVKSHIISNAVDNVCDNNRSNYTLHRRMGKIQKSGFPDVLLINCRSIKNKTLALNTIIEAHDPDCVVLTETWVDDDIPDQMFCPNGFDCFRKDRDIHGGGVAILIKSSLQAEAVDLGAPPVSIKTDLLQVKISSLKLHLYAVYHPYWKETTAHDKLLAFLNSIAECNISDHMNILVAGDLNGCVERLDEFTLSNNFVQVVDFPTRLGNTLDVLLTNSPDAWIAPKRLAPLATSDHSIIQLKASKPIKPNTWYELKRVINKNSLYRLGSKLATIDWSWLRDIEDVEDCSTAFYDILCPLVDECMPFKRIKMRSNDKWWITPHIKMLMNQKDKAHKRKDHGAVLVLQQLLHKTISSAKNKSTAERLNNCDSLKKRWRVIKSITKARKSQPALSMDTAMKINLNFCSVFKKEDIEEFDLNSFSQNCTHSPPLIEAFEVYISLSRITSFAVGPDNISGLVFKKFSEFLADPLAIIFNKSILQNKIPSIWKMAYVVPIPKGKGEFRPISLLCHPMKVLEKFVLSKLLMPSLNRPFCTSQFAFVPNVIYGGCCNALTTARTWTLHALDSGADYVTWLAIDFKKAFDSVSHKKIMDTLAVHFGVRSSVLIWLFNYLSSRKQCIFISPQLTTPYLACSSGVPQGSILGPTLFAILLDPCLVNCASIKLVCYADDCTLLHKVFPNEVDNLQEKADQFISQAEGQKLEVNSNKCQIIHFPRKPSLSIAPPPLVLKSTSLLPLNSVKILGVWFTSDLKWTTHLQYVYKKCARASYLIKLLHSHGVRGGLLWNASEALVFSHLVYCYPVFCDCSTSALTRFNSLYKRMSLLCKVHTPIDLRSRLEKQCHQLAKLISSHPGHPLEECFAIRHNTSNINLRKASKFIPLSSKGCKLKNSFTKFAC